MASCHCENTIATPRAEGGNRRWHPWPRGVAQPGAIPAVPRRCPPMHAKDVGHLKSGSSHRLTRLLKCLISSVLDTSIASRGLATA